MEKKSYKKRGPNFKLWGFVLIVISIFLILIFLNIIPSPESDFQYGRFPFLFVALFFLMVGIICFFNENFLKINEKYRKIILLIFWIVLLVPFHIILIKEKNIDYNYIGFAFFTVLFDIIGIAILITILKDLNRNAKK